MHRGVGGSSAGPGEKKATTLSRDPVTLAPQRCGDEQDSPKGGKPRVYVRQSTAVPSKLRHRAGKSIAFAGPRLSWCSVTKRARQLRSLDQEVQSSRGPVLHCAALAALTARPSSRADVMVVPWPLYRRTVEAAVTRGLRQGSPHRKRGGPAMLSPRTATLTS